MNGPHPICYVSYVLAAATLLAGTGAAPARAQSNPEDPNFVHQFFLFDNDVFVRFVYITDAATTIVERENGKCVQKVSVSEALISVFDTQTGDLLAEGEGNLNIQATVNCATRIYDGERIVITSAGDLTDVGTGEPLRLHVRGVLIKGILRVFEIQLDPTT
jgi:hypothetical protein